MFLFPQLRVFDGTIRGSGSTRAAAAAPPCLTSQFASDSAGLLCLLATVTTHCRERRRSYCDIFIILYMIFFIGFVVIFININIIIPSVSILLMFMFIVITIFIIQTASSSRSSSGTADAFQRVSAATQEFCTFCLAVLLLLLLLLLFFLTRGLGGPSVTCRPAG